MRRSLSQSLSAGLVVAVVLCAPLRAAYAVPPVSIETTFDQDIAGLDQTLALTVTITVHGGQSIDQIELPHAAALQVVGTSKSEQSRFSMGPSGVDSSHTTLIRLSLRPLQAGNFTLSPAQVVTGGHIYKGNAVHVKIVAAGQGPAPQAPAPRQQQNPFGNFFGGGGFQAPPGFLGPQAPADPSDEEDPFAQLFSGGRAAGGEDVILGANVDKRQVTLGQQITYTIRLYTRADVSEFSDLKLPGFDGFWGEDLETPTRPTPHMQTLGGVPYEVYLIKKKALFADRAGVLTIEPAQIDVSVGLGFFRGHKVHRESTPLTITVQPLPQGAPAAFPATNVGQWRFTASLSPASVPVGEPATLSLVVEGQGNLHGLTLPSVPAIPGLRSYDPTSTDKPVVQGGSFAGRRQVDLIFIPQRTGDFELPPLTFQWFDPQQPGGAGYQSTTTPKIILHASAGIASAAAGTPGSGSGQNVLESAYRPLHERAALLDDCRRGARHLPDPLSAVPTAFGFGIPPALLGGVWLTAMLRARRQRGASAQRGRRAYRVARQKLRNDLASPADLAQALFGYLEDRLGEPMAGLTFPDLRARLISRGVEESTARSTLQAIELAESLRYQPMPSGPGAGSGRDLGKLKAMAEFALEALERTALSPGKPSGTGTGVAA